MGQGMGQSGMGQGMGQSGMGQGVGQSGMGQSGMGQSGMGQSGVGQSGMNLGASTTTFQDCEDTDACSAFRISIFGTPQEPNCGLGPVDQACPKTCNACEEACNLCCTTN